MNTMEIDLLRPKTEFITADKYKPLPSDYQSDIDKKKAELELKKLEIEIAKLEKPDTKMDYFSEMLQLQKNHFDQLLAMQQQHANLQMEIEKLKIGGQDDDSMLYMLDIIKPLLPQILGSQQMKGVETKPKMNKEEYLKAIQEGKITPEMGFEDFKMEFPDLAKNMTFEQFKIQFENVKKNGLPASLK